MPTGTFTSETSNSAVTNNATVTFTNAWNGSKESVGTATAAPVTIYSYPLNVIKTDLLSPGGENYLKATFAVSASTSDGKKGEPVGTVTTDESSTGGFIGLAANTWYLVEESDAPDDYTDANLDVAKFWVYIKAEEGNPTSTPAYYFYGGSEVPDDFLTNPGNAKIESAYVNPSVNFWDDTVEDVKKDAIDNMSVLVLNAKSRSDMPSTGGRILLWAGIAAALGLGAVGFGIAGVRRSRNKAAQAA